MQLEEQMGALLRDVANITWVGDEDNTYQMETFKASTVSMLASFIHRCLMANTFSIDVS